MLKIVDRIFCCVSIFSESKCDVTVQFNQQNYYSLKFHAPLHIDDGYDRSTKTV